MASWILIPCLTKLFAEFDALAPGRAHDSDGSIGDAAHQAEVSDHNPDETGSVPIHDADKINEVHAIDVDSDLRTAGLSMETVVQFLLGRCRSGAEKRLRYVIYNRRIWSASSNWVQQAYTGASAHTEHAHFSASYESSLEASTASWHLEDIPVALNDADKKWIASLLAPAISSDRNVNAVANVRFQNPYDGRWMEYGTMVEYAPSRGQVQGVSDQVAALALARTPEQIAAALPDDVAKQVHDILKARLNA